MVLLSLSMFACLEKTDSRKIKINNNSDKVVYVFKSQSDEFTNPYIRLNSDTLLKYERAVSDDSFNIRYIVGWNSFIENSKAGKMRIFLVEQDSVDKYGIKEVLMKNIYTKVYKVNLQDLKDCNWEISYNGK